MAEQRKPFRFRLPWTSAAPTPRPATESLPSRPTTETKSTTGIPIQRPPFRPPGIAPVQSPSTQARNQTGGKSLLPSLSRRTQTRATSVPPPSSRTGPQSRASSVPPSPTRTASKSRAASKSQPALQPQSTSPLASEHGGQTLQSTAPKSSQLTQNITQPASLASQQEKPTAAVSKPQSQKSRSEKELPSDSISNSQGYIQVSTTSQSDKEKIQLTRVSGDEKVAAPPSTEATETSSNQNIDSISRNPNPVSDIQSKFHETQEERKSVQEPMNEQTIKDKMFGQPLESSTADLKTTSASGTQTFQAEEKQQGAQQTFDRKEISYPGGKEIKDMRSVHPVNRNISSISHQQPVVPNGEGSSLQKEIREDISKFFHKLSTVNSSHPMDDKQVSVITLAGDNRGATMHIGSESDQKEETVHIHRGYRHNPEDSPDMTTDGEGSFRKGSKDSMKEDKRTRTYINSNIQNLNNSIMFDSSITERNPGVHLILRHISAESMKSNEKSKLFETCKAEFNIIPAEKLTYQPNVQTRSLRDIFLESSDSDPDHLEKPWHHGCRYNSVEKKKDKDIGIL
ncbi:NADH/NADPH oxidoreductase [Quillaja saponaria]|uniref:NADH/NADPH oxidoreductase n=1 Tax=Quillaja saponaria TaxID=32244 RepID=A0AAD7LGV6_QUISA|nr:NADH/NADPH oxidoreductase [Quillaja saponaria]